MRSASITAVLLVSFAITSTFARKPQQQDCRTRPTIVIGAFLVDSIVVGDRITPGSPNQGDRFSPGWLHHWAVGRLSVSEIVSAETADSLLPSSVPSVVYYRPTPLNPARESESTFEPYGTPVLEAAAWRLDSVEVGDYAGQRRLQALEAEDLALVRNDIASPETRSFVGFPQIPPNIDADPNRRSAATFRIPHGLIAERVDGWLVVRFDEESMEDVELTTGYRMVVAYNYSLDATYDGKEISLGGARGAPPYTLLLPNRPVRKISEGWLKKLGVGSGRIELKVTYTLFETDLPPQHMWNPESGATYYDVLWEGDVRDTIEATSAR